MTTNTRTYLSKNNYTYSVETTLFILFLSLLFSLAHWSSSLDLVGTKKQIFQQHQYYKIFSSVLIHADLKHFLNNSFLLTIFGILNHRYFGPIFFPFITYLSSIFTHILALLTYSNNNTVLVGASGWVFLMGGSWLTMYILIERKDSLKKRIFKAIAVGLVIFSPQTILPQVSYRAHLIGFIMGILTSLLYFPFIYERVKREELYEELTEDSLEEVEHQ